MPSNRVVWVKWMVHAGVYADAERGWRKARSPSPTPKGGNACVACVVLLLLEQWCEFRSHRLACSMSIHDLWGWGRLIARNLCSTWAEARGLVDSLLLLPCRRLFPFLLNLHELGTHVLVAVHLILKGACNTVGDVTSLLVVRGDHSVATDTKLECGMFFRGEMSVGFAERGQSTIDFLFHPLCIGGLPIRDQRLHLGTKLG